MGTRTEVTEESISDGLSKLGLDASSAVIVHSSLRSFGHVVGGADAVCRALASVCGTVMVPAGTWDLTGLPAPPGLVRPHNAYYSSASWPDFDRAVAGATPFSPGLPVDGWLGLVAETMRRSCAHVRSTHPLFSYLAVGRHAAELVAAQRDDWPLGPIDALENLGGDVLLLGVGHTSNTTIHLAEQRLGRSRFFRYATTGAGLWREFPNIPGESHRFDEIEPALAPVTSEVMIGACRARRIPVAEVIERTQHVIRSDPAALLCEDEECRCGAALRQRLAVLAG